MELSPFHILGLSLPTLVVLYAMATPALDGAPSHLEKYANGDSGFEARFDLNPDGWLRRRDPAGVRFAGSLSDGGETFEIRGVRHLVDGKPSYRFTGAGGEGRGEIRNGKPGCPGELHFQWNGPAGKTRAGVLASGPCYWF